MASGSGLSATENTPKMTTISLAGHVIEFADCHEMGQGGPEICTMSIDGRPVVNCLQRLQSRFFDYLPSVRFHPSPLAFEGEILIPMWGRPKFYLVKIDPASMNIRRLTWLGQNYMRLLEVVGNEVVFATWHDASKTRRVSLR
jgi:hypothetical protein